LQRWNFLVAHLQLPGKLPGGNFRVISTPAKTCCNPLAGIGLRSQLKTLPAHHQRSAAAGSKRQAAFPASLWNVHQARKLIDKLLPLVHKRPALSRACAALLRVYRRNLRNQRIYLRHRLRQGQIDVALQRYQIAEF